MRCVSALGAQALRQAALGGPTELCSTQTPGLIQVNRIRTDGGQALEFRLSSPSAHDVQPGQRIFREEPRKQEAAQGLPRAGHAVPEQWDGEGHAQAHGGAGGGPGGGRRGT